MLPINEQVNCERILLTHKYQTKNHKDLEEIWLIKYLRTQKKSKNNIYQIWLNLYLHKTSKEKDDSNPRSKFNIKWELSSNAVFHNDAIIKIGKNQLDFINSQEMPEWVKRYMLIVIAYFQITKIPYFSTLPVKELVNLTKTTMRPGSVNNMLEQKLLECGFLVRKEINTTYDYGFETNHLGLISNIEYNQKNTHSVLEINILPQEEIAIECSTILDIPKYFSLITMYKVCEKCGRKFKYNSKTKRNICLKCWKKQESERVKNKMREIRQNNQLSKTSDNN